MKSRLLWQRLVLERRRFLFFFHCKVFVWDASYLLSPWFWKLGGFKVCFIEPPLQPFLGIDKVKIKRLREESSWYFLKKSVFGEPWLIWQK